MSTRLISVRKKSAKKLKEKRAYLASRPRRLSREIWVENGLLAKPVW
jgi:hypothetical protein